MVEPRFNELLEAHGLVQLQRSQTSTVQINLGKRCNQACRHCHVDAGPTRTEMMDAKTLERLMVVLHNSKNIHNIDITGGAPELHPAFRDIVVTARSLGRNVIDRCNLTILEETGQEDTAEFLAKQQVEIVASLPCYGPDNVNKQRGAGVFSRSIAGIKKLNTYGYGRPGTGLTLNLVYNPLGPFLPPDQQGLEQTYKDRLSQDFGVHFNRLYTLTNMPIARFRRDLERSGRLEDYFQLLGENFNPAAAQHVMCKDLISIDWRGQLYDCDFNQMLQLPAGVPARNIWEIDSLDALVEHPITTGAHCLGCTAGAGSSCGGALQ